MTGDEGRIEKRILVISSEIGKLISVKTVTWSEELPNIADFDVVIMDLVSLYSDVENNKIKLNTLRYPNKEAVNKLIRSGGELIVISYPATHLMQPVPERISGQPMQPRGISSCISNDGLLCPLLLMIFTGGPPYPSKISWKVALQFKRLKIHHFVSTLSRELKNGLIIWNCVNSKRHLY